MTRLNEAPLRGREFTLNLAVEALRVRRAPPLLEPGPSQGRGPTGAAASAPPIAPACAAALDAVFAPADRSSPATYVSAETDAARAPLGEAWRASVATLAAAPAPAALALTYPLEGALFPPDLATPILRFADPAPADRWVVELTVAGGAARVQVVTARARTAATSNGRR